LLYLDAGVFIYAALNRQSIGKRARSLIQRIGEGREEAASCALSVDEIVWVVSKHRAREDALAAGRAFLSVPNLKILPVNQDSLLSALTLMRRYDLDPRDAIHASTALLNRCTTIVSADSHFDIVVEIPRKMI
jgi:predicted nucleic acid-binding protein